MAIKKHTEEFIKLTFKLPTFMRFREQFLLRLQVGCNLVRRLSLITYAPIERGGGGCQVSYTLHITCNKGGRWSRYHVQLRTSLIQQRCQNHSGSLHIFVAATWLAMLAQQKGHIVPTL